MSTKSFYLQLKKLLVLGTFSLYFYANNIEGADIRDYTPEANLEDYNKEFPKIISNRLNYCGINNSISVQLTEYEKIEEDLSTRILANYPANLTFDEITNNALINANNLFANEETLATLRLENQDKIAYICERENLSYEEFNEFACVCIKEAKPFSGKIEDYEAVYIDAYAVANTFYNRVHSITWRNDTNINNYEGAGESLYGQITAKKQSSVYLNGDHEYLIDIDKTGLPGYQAVIDMLYYEVPMHNYLSFKSSDSDPEGKEQFVSGGNRYHNIMSLEDVYIPEENQTLTLTQNY